MKVYVAGSSKELSFARRFIAAARFAGCEITFDWPEHFAQYSVTAPPAAEDLFEAGARCIDGLRSADVFVLLIPSTPSKGAWYELASARSAREFEASRSGCDVGPVIVTVGDFAGLDCWGDADGEIHFDDPELALEWLRIERLGRLCSSAGEEARLRDFWRDMDLDFARSFPGKWVDETPAEKLDDSPPGETVAECPVDPPTPPVAPLAGSTEPSIVASSPRAGVGSPVPASWYPPPPAAPLPPLVGPSESRPVPTPAEPPPAKHAPACGLALSSLAPDELCGSCGAYAGAHRYYARKDRWQSFITRKALEIPGPCAVDFEERADGMRVVIRWGAGGWTSAKHDGLYSTLRAFVPAGVPIVMDLSGL